MFVASHAETDVVHCNRGSIVVAAVAITADVKDWIGRGGRDGDSMDVDNIQFTPALHEQSVDLDAV